MRGRIAAKFVTGDGGSPTGCSWKTAFGKETDCLCEELRLMINESQIVVTKFDARETPLQ